MDRELKIAVVGINHKTSNVAEREKYQLGKKEIAPALTNIFSLGGVDSIMILSTCNRLEFYMVLEPDADAFEIFNGYFTKLRGLDTNKGDKLIYTLEGKDATTHLFRVISGLDSLVMGEYQIQGQVKEAYSLACQHEAVGKMLHKLLHAAFRAGKKVRSQTCMGTCRQSVSGVAAQIMIENLNKDSVVTIIGVNENSKIMAKALSSAGFHKYIFVNRTFYKADQMAHNFGGTAKDFSEIENALFDSDAVYTSTGSQDYIVGSELMQRLAGQERCPHLIIDMAVPRDIDVAGLPESIKCYDISALKEYLERERHAAMIDVPKAEHIILGEADVFQAWSDTQTNGYINPYAEKFEMIRQQLIEENMEQLPSQSLEKVDKLTRSLVHRLQSVFVRAMIKSQNGEKH